VPASTSAEKLGLLLSIQTAMPPGTARRLEPGESVRIS
jgi:hypothetical protein